MSLEIQGDVNSSASYDNTGKSVGFVELTGAYNAQSNIGGYDPTSVNNPAITDVYKVLTSYWRYDRSIDQSETSDLIAYRQYLANTSPVTTYDNTWIKTAIADSYFNAPYTETITDKATDTGQRIIYTGYLPTSAVSPNGSINLTNVMLGYETTEIIPDGVAKLVLEYYGGANLDAADPLTAGVRYLVSNGSDPILYSDGSTTESGGTFLAGETFLAIDGYPNFTDTGSATVYPLIASFEKYFLHYYNTEKAVTDLGQLLKSDRCKCGDLCGYYDILALLQILKDSVSPYTLNITLAERLIVEINQKVVNYQRQNCS
jgi:hypothetical protein